MSEYKRRYNLSDFSKQENEILAFDRAAVPETSALQKRIVLLAADLPQQQQTRVHESDKASRWWLKILPTNYAVAFSLLLVVMTSAVWLPLDKGVETTPFAVQQSAFENEAESFGMQSEGYKEVSLGEEDWQSYFLLEEEMLLSQL